MIKTIKAKTIEEKLLFTFGFLGTMPILEFLGFTLFTWLTMMMVINVLISSKGLIRITRLSKHFVILSCSMVLSSIIGVIFNAPNFWKELAFKNLIWQIMYGIFILYYLQEKRIIKCLFYIKGVYFASIAHCVWGVLQVVSYRLFGIAINKAIFYDILGVEMASYVQMKGDSLTLTGFCWNAGNIAPLVVIGFLLSESIFLKGFFLLVAAVSGSRTLILGMVACLGINVILSIGKKTNMKMKRKILVGLIFLGALAFVFLFANRDLAEGIVFRIKDASSSFSLAYLQTQTSSRVHARYWTSILKVTKWNSFANNLFGYGIGCSGYPFANIFNQFSDHAWTVECDYINNLWGIGYVGFALWYSWYFVSVLKGVKIDKKYLILFGALLLEGVTYNVTFNWCYIMLIMIFGLIGMNINIFSTKQTNHINFISV